jgi:hypothetical protein
MRSSKRFIAFIIEIVIGVALIVCSAMGWLDSYWSGMGTALIFVGAIFMFQRIRYIKDETYRENVDVEAKDERNRYIRTKAWSWAGYWFVMISAVASIVLKLVGLDEYSVIAGGSVCVLVLLYWLSYFILRKKY